jgi:hypothetical protein
MSLYDRLPDKDFIRLVVVSAGNWSEPICCRLRAVSFRVNPRYEALSYAWGLSGATRPILIEGSTVNVRNNLERALRYIRQKDNDVTFWVDALVRMTPSATESKLLNYCCCSASTNKTKKKKVSKSE